MTVEKQSQGGGKTLPTYDFLQAKAWKMISLSITKQAIWP